MLIIIDKEVDVDAGWLFFNINIWKIRWPDISVDLASQSKTRFKTNSEGIDIERIQTTSHYVQEVDDYTGDSLITEIAHPGQQL